MDCRPKTQNLLTFCQLSYLKINIITSKKSLKYNIIHILSYTNDDYLVFVGSEVLSPEEESQSETRPHRPRLQRSKAQSRKTFRLRKSRMDVNEIIFYTNFDFVFDMDLWNIFTGIQCQKVFIYFCFVFNMDLGNIFSDIQCHNIFIVGQDHLPVGGQTLVASKHI